MNANSVIIRGTLNGSGTLELPPIALPPGPVEVVVRPIEPARAGEDLLAFLTRIRAEQKARGHAPRTKEEIDENMRQARDEWEEHQLAIEQFKNH